MVGVAEQDQDSRLQFFSATTSYNYQKSGRSKEQERYSRLNRSASIHNLADLVLYDTEIIGKVSYQRINILSHLLILSCILYLVCLLQSLYV